MAQLPDTRYALNGDVSIAYQVVGEGDVDILFIPGFVSHVEHVWEIPACARFFSRLASFARLILFDKRGTGLSDPADRAAPLEDRMDDARAVLDAVGSERAVVIGFSEGGALGIMLAATYPERVQSLVLLASTSRFAWAEDWPAGWTDEAYDGHVSHVSEWGQGPYLELWAESLIGNEDAKRAFSRLERLSASPGMVRTLFALVREIDVREICGSVQVPTLVLHATGDPTLTVGHARDTAALIPGARLHEVDSVDHLPWVSGASEYLEVIEDFITGAHGADDPERVLATVLFSDIVDSTGMASRLGDRKWRAVLEDYERAVDRQLDRFRGRNVKQLGDGHLAAFDGPARAVRCAQALVDAARSFDVDLRCGIHTGECEVRGDDLAGVAVHVGARVGALAGPGEVLVSSTVKDLVAGSGLTFEDRGEHALKGVPDPWRVYAASSSSS